MAGVDLCADNPIYFQKDTEVYSHHLKKNVKYKKGKPLSRGGNTKPDSNPDTEGDAVRWSQVHYREIKNDLGMLKLSMVRNSVVSYDEN